jgi:hypothetical protein
VLQQPRFAIWPPGRAQRDQRRPPWPRSIAQNLPGWPIARAADPELARLQIVLSVTTLL